MIHRISSMLSVRLANYIGWQEKAEILTYGLEMILGELFKFGILILVAMPFGLTTETLLILAAALPLRLMSGGGHCMTFARCTVLTILIYLLLAMIASLVLSAFGSGVAIVGLPVVVLISLTVIHLWVPGENPNRTFNDEKERQKFKKLSRFFIVLWVASCYLVYLIAPGSFGIYFVSTASGILWQSFFVTPAGYKLLNALEHLFRFL